MEGFVNDNGDPKPVVRRCGWCYMKLKTAIMGKDGELYCDDYCETTREKYVAMWVFDIKTDR